MLYTMIVSYRKLSPLSLFFFNDTASPEIYTLSLHDALPISLHIAEETNSLLRALAKSNDVSSSSGDGGKLKNALRGLDRKSTRLNSSHGYISYAVFCLKKKTDTNLSYRILVQTET